MDTKAKSQFQERLVNLFLRLNGYLQSGYIPHSEIWGNAGTDVDRIGIRFPNHSQEEREISCYENLDIPKESIDIILAEVKNSSLKFNDTITKIENGAEINWGQILNWIGLFDKEQIQHLIPKMISITEKHGQIENNSYPKYIHENQYGKITIRPILFSIETDKAEKDTKKWINGKEIMSFLWYCFCPEIRRDKCSTRYPFTLWGDEFLDIVEYIKRRHKKGLEIGTLEEMYKELIN